MRIVPLVTPYTIAVTRRQYIVWRKLIWSAMATNVANPILMLFAFGFGLGALVEAIDGVSYMAFVVPGMIAYSAMFAASFETTIGSFSRYYMQKNWDATLSTPVTLSELLFGEVLWASAKAMISAVAVLLVGVAWGGIPSITGALFALPIVFVASIGFACHGLVATSYARGYEFFSYFFSFWITPGFVFSGVFFEIDRFPGYVQILSWALPATHLIEIIRPLSIGMALDPAKVAIHMAYTVALAAASFWLAYRNMRRRMFD
jgi:lipooligosaccharide transport system permease protein